jgi:hypothetical protein
MFENNKIAKIKAIFKGIKDYKKGITGKTYWTTKMEVYYG